MEIDVGPRVVHLLGSIFMLVGRYIYELANCA